MAMSRKREDDLTNAAYKRGSGRNTFINDDYKNGGIGMVSGAGASAALRSVARQKAIEKKKAKMKAMRTDLENKAKAKRGE